MIRLAALIVKELIVLLKDPRGRFVIFGPPIIQLIVFGYAASFDLNDVPIAVFDQNNSRESRDLLARFTGSPNFRLVQRIDDEDQIAPLLDLRQVLMVVHLRPDFLRQLQRGEAQVQLLLDARGSNTALIAAGYAQRIITRFAADQTRSKKVAPPTYLVTRAWFNPNLQSRWFFVPGIIGVLTLVVTMLVTALSIAKEREQGTFDQLLVMPYRRWELLVGKTVPGVLLGVLDATLIVTVAVLWFEIPLLGSLMTLYLGLLLYLLSSIGVGLMISSFAVTQQQGLLGGFLFLVPSVILSGFSTPIANMPQWIQTLTYANPLRYFLIILRDVFLKGTPTHLLVDQYWPLALIGLVTMSTATWMFRQRVA